MEKFDFKGLDFRALEVLKTVHDEGSFSRAADRFLQNQSTISYTVDRLRRVFDDPLFVRSGRGVQPTERCRAIVAGVDEVVDRMEALVRPQAFDPATSSAEFTVSCNHFERSVFLPEIVRRLSVAAPDVRVNVIQSRVQGHEQLRRGDCDLLLSPVPASRTDVFEQKLFEDRYVCVVGPAHPHEGDAMDLAAYAAARHVALTYEGEWRSAFHVELEANGIQPEIRVDMPSSGGIYRLVEDTDLVLTVPSLLARSFPPGIRVLESPFDATVSIYQFWTTRTQNAAAHAWLRALIADISSKLPGAARHGVAHAQA